MPKPLYIVTPCCRPWLLSRVRDSLHMDLVTQWIIVHDSAVPRVVFGDHPNIVELHVHNATSQAGNAQRNLALDTIPADTDGFVYFQDDDNCVHPDFWIAYPALTDTTKFYTWDQFRQGHLLPGNRIIENCIDTAMFMVPRAMIGDLRWVLDYYAADAVLITTIAAANTGCHVYIKRMLCMYNCLSTGPHAQCDATSSVFNTLAASLYKVIEGSCNVDQLACLQMFMWAHPEIRKVAEIGFNGGRSCAAMLCSRPNISVTSYDIGTWPCVQPAASLIHAMFPRRHTLVIGDSTVTLPRAAAETYDVVFVDGEHIAPVPALDIANGLAKVRPGGFVLVNDYCVAFPDVVLAYDHAVTAGTLVTIAGPHAFADGRCMIFAQKAALS